MSRGFLLSLVLVDLDILLFLLMIILLLMKHHSELLHVYSNFAKMVENQFSKRIKNFRSDNALEYTLYAFQAVLHSYGTVHQLTYLGTSQQNGRAKWKLCHILDTIRVFFLSAKVPTPFWVKAALHAVHTISHIPSLIIQNQTPYEHFFGSPPNYNHLCSFSFACFFLFQPHEHNKLVLWSRLCCFLSYGKTQKGYLLQCCILGTSLLCWALSLSFLPIYLLCLRSFSKWATHSFYSYSWSSYKLLYPTTIYFWCLF